MEVRVQTWEVRVETVCVADGMCNAFLPEAQWLFEHCLVYMRCTQMLRDQKPWDPEAATAACKEQWGVTPRRLWATEEWGGKKIGALKATVQK
eukprot:scaffold117333_cov17-Tisochrysis_lutea.AAC.1